jgi:hypothetical protein
MQQGPAASGGSCYFEEAAFGELEEMQGVIRMYLFAGGARIPSAFAALQPEPQ